MSLTGSFTTTQSGALSPPVRDKPKPTRPFSLRLSEAERARLLDEARGAPLGTYIRAKVLGAAVPGHTRRSGLRVEDRAALAQALALLGRSQVASNLNQLAHLANSGALPVTPETAQALHDALTEVRELRALLISALGMKPEGHA